MTMTMQQLRAELEDRAVRLMTLSLEPEPITEKEKMSFAKQVEDLAEDLLDSLPFSWSAQAVAKEFKEQLQG